MTTQETTQPTIKPYRTDALAILFQEEVTFWKSKAFALQSRLMDEIDKLQELEAEIELLRNPAKPVKPPASQV